jgi:hypothetical protein
MSIILKQYDKPNFGKVQFECDDEINKKLNKYELTKQFLNKSNTTVFIGKQGSGKTSLMINFVTKIYKKCFHHIYVFMPASSRASLKNNIFDKHLDPSKIYDEFNAETINDVYEKLKTNTENKERSLIIYDDVQQKLKNVEILSALNNIVANQRHLRVVNFIMLQNYINLDAKIRDLTQNIILFKLGKRQTEQIFKELIESHKDKFDIIRDFVFNEAYQWLFINIPTQRIFKQFDEVIYNNDSENE